VSFIWKFLTLFAGGVLLVPLAGYYLRYLGYHDQQAYYGTVLAFFCYAIGSLLCFVREFEA